LFRFFDILKPPPVRQLERLHGGVGIMMDDVAAGLYALLVGVIVYHWW
jgi:phosphatidylglycerophosphatase A